MKRDFIIIIFIFLVVAGSLVSFVHAAKFNLQATVEVLLKGDVNRDCKVDIFDLAKVGLCYGCMEEQECWTSEDCYKADLSGNKKVDIFDLAIVGLNYGGECES